MKTIIKYTRSEIRFAHKLLRHANDEGTIQAGAMLDIAPHNRPELHTTMSVGRAFEALTGKPFDADFFCR